MKTVTAETLAAAIHSYWFPGTPHHGGEDNRCAEEAAAILAAIPPDDRYCDGCGASHLSMRHFADCPLSPDPRLGALAAVRSYVFTSLTISATDRHRLLTFIDQAPPDPRLDALLAALRSEDEIAHGEAWDDVRKRGLGVCAYCDDEWPCRTQQGIDRALAAFDHE